MQAAAIDDKTQQAINSIYSGSLANNIKSNMRFVFYGVLFGAAAGIVVATFTGNCRLCFGFWGGLAGGVVGYTTAPKQ